MKPRNIADSDRGKQETKEWKCKFCPSVFDSVDEFCRHEVSHLSMISDATGTATSALENMHNRRSLITRRLSAGNFVDSHEDDNLSKVGVSSPARSPTSRVPVPASEADSKKTSVVSMIKVVAVTSSAPLSDGTPTKRKRGRPATQNPVNNDSASSEENTAPKNNEDTVGIPSAISQSPSIATEDPEDNPAEVTIPDLVKSTSEVLLDCGSPKVGLSVFSAENSENSELESPKSPQVVPPGDIHSSEISQVPESSLSYDTEESTPHLTDLEPAKMDNESLANTDSVETLDEIEKFLRESIPTNFTSEVKSASMPTRPLNNESRNRSNTLAEALNDVFGIDEIEAHLSPKPIRVYSRKRSGEAIHNVLGKNLRNSASLLHPPLPDHDLSGSRSRGDIMIQRRPPPVINVRRKHILSAKDVKNGMRWKGTNVYHRKFRAALEIKASESISSPHLEKALPSDLMLTECVANSGTCKACDRISDAQLEREQFDMEPVTIEETKTESLINWFSERDIVTTDPMAEFRSVNAPLVGIYSPDFFALVENDYDAEQHEDEDVEMGLMFLESTYNNIEKSKEQEDFRLKPKPPFRSMMVRHVIVKAFVKGFPCNADNCKRTFVSFPTRDELAKHRRARHGFTCHICGQWFARNIYRKGHMARHAQQSEKAKVKKEVSLVRAARRPVKRQYIKVEHDENFDVDEQYICDHCGKVFRSMAALSQHITIVKRLAQRHVGAHYDSDSESETDPRYMNAYSEEVEKRRAVRFMEMHSDESSMGSHQGTDVFDGLVGNDGNLLDIAMRLSGVEENRQRKIKEEEVDEEEEDELTPQDLAWQQVVELESALIEAEEYDEDTLYIDEKPQMVKDTELMEEDEVMPQAPRVFDFIPSEFAVETFNLASTEEERKSQFGRPICIVDFRPELSAVQKMSSGMLPGKRQREEGEVDDVSDNSDENAKKRSRGGEEEFAENFLDEVVVLDEIVSSDDAGEVITKDEKKRKRKKRKEMNAKAKLIEDENDVEFRFKTSLDALEKVTDPSRGFMKITMPSAAISEILWGPIKEFICNLATEKLPEIVSCLANEEDGDPDESCEKVVSFGDIISAASGNPEICSSVFAEDDVSFVICDEEEAKSVNYIEKASYSLNASLVEGIEEAEKGSSPHPPQNRRSFFAECFNCRGPHTIQKCRKPHNYLRIEFNRKRKDILSGQRKPELMCNVQKHIVPGRISGALRYALGLGNNHLPPWIYRMRKAGYPPGWLRAAEIKHDSLQVINADNPELEQSGVVIDRNKIIEYPGFNVWPPHGTIDEPEDGIKQGENSLTENWGLSFSTTEEQEAEMKQKRSENPFKIQDAALPSTNGFEENEEEVEVSSTGNVSALGLPALEIMTTSLEVTEVPAAKVPSLDSFTSDITDHIPYENLPNSTGQYDVLKELFKKARQSSVGN
ncbi:unnamed protein product [Notodromas monacha]|uniref:C2H2-type domain-containing protein n=1 Tax=Notodromas monacha TaxID=399045 RepID=A0A7R9BE49_9CRUS|nr:unnamed protein product [Notodromas monacha]CAG0912571.1 unnamed protein product [Notodromas monacha]